MYLKEKRTGEITGRGYADGRSQREYIERIDTSSPTASLVTILLTCTIDAFERRDITIVYIPRVFLQTKMPESEDDVHVILDGQMTELVAKFHQRLTANMCITKEDSHTYTVK